MLWDTMHAEEIAMADRVAAVRVNLEKACTTAGRHPDEVLLVAVSKRKGPDAVSEAVSCGLRTFGENRVQEAREKIPACPSQADWHLIGSLQSNKARLAVELFSCIHSIDRVSLLQRLESVCAEVGRPIRGLLQVNVSGEASKHGVSPDDAPTLIEAACTCRNVEVVGLMTMPPALPDPQAAAPYFARLRELRDAWQAASGLPLPELSMGMSHDYDVAIAEGATMVRVGTALFGERS